MEHIETTISAATIRMRYANDPDPVRATEWFAFEVPVGSLKLPVEGGPEPALGDPESRHLAAIRLAALRYVRDAIGDETRRLAHLVSHIA